LALSELLGGSSASSSESRSSDTCGVSSVQSWQQQHKVQTWSVETSYTQLAGCCVS
jgi:hypothetical protein